ncbi:hypothetical protein KNE206_65420 [Kitasatospora sp. NE20-6]
MEGRGTGYVLAVACNHEFTAQAGRFRADALATSVRVAGSRWRVEETFQAGKGLAGLDEHQVRRYVSWFQWVALAMLAHAFLAVVRAEEHGRHPAPDRLIPLTCNEIQRLFITSVVRPVQGVAYRFTWSECSPWSTRSTAPAGA